ncbi:MAG: alpha/beta hydrolase [Sphingobium sp.]|nr:alpha/beta hydrolase [Sphingobium sp.]
MYLNLSRRTLLTGLASGILAGSRATGALPAPFWSQRVSTRVQGSGPDVLLIPGLGSGPAIWNRAMRDVPGYRYHLLHVRGFAGLKADGNARGPLLTPIMEEIARYIAANRLQRPAVIGHSMGGTLAMMLALAHPDQVGRVMVVDMLPTGAGMIGGTASGMGYLGDQLFGYFTATEAGRRAFANMLRDYTPGGADSDPDVVAGALREMGHVDLTAQLRQLRAPLTVTYAVPSDAQLRQSQVRRFSTAYAGVKGAKLIPIGPSGHVIMDDQPGRFAEAMRGFLK